MFSWYAATSAQPNWTREIFFFLQPNWSLVSAPDEASPAVLQRLHAKNQLAQ